MESGFNPYVTPNLNKIRGNLSYREPQPKGNMYDHDTRQIDSTPLGTATLLLGAAALLVAFKAMNFKFVVGVGG